MGVAHDAAVQAPVCIVVIEPLGQLVNLGGSLSGEHGLGAIVTMETFFSEIQPFNCIFTV
jgi:hypothetical protein